MGARIVRRAGETTRFSSSRNLACSESRMISIHSIFIGKPEVITDASGRWESSIFRKPVTGSIELGFNGLAGDQVTDRIHHGSPTQAVCVHPIEHYAYWNKHFGLEGAAKLGPGSVGENWTIDGGNENQVCVGDIFAVGSAEVQVTGPRGPCSKQERKLKLKGFLKKTIENLRTGLYLRVVTPGRVQAGNEWKLCSRPNPWLTSHLINTCYYREANLEMVERMLATPELEDGWKIMLRQKFGVHP